LPTCILSHLPPPLHKHGWFKISLIKIQRDFLFLQNRTYIEADRIYILYFLYVSLAILYFLYMNLTINGLFFDIFVFLHTGGASIKQYHVLNDKRYIITKDSEERVAMWDVLTV